MFFILIILFVAVFFYFRHKTWKALPWPENGLKPALYQAHHGHWRGGLQENTLSAFRQAQTLGFQMIEMDVQLSQDLIPVIFHDRDLMRLAQREEWVSRAKFEDLKTWATVAQLKEILQDPKTPAAVNIEIKTDHFFDHGIEKVIAQTVSECGAEKRVLFSSFNPLSLWRMKKHLPQVPRALLATEELAPANKIYLRQLWFAPYIGIHLLHLDGRYLKAQDVLEWKKRGVPVAVWTVNDPALARTFLNAGAVSIITDLELSQISAD